MIYPGRGPVGYLQLAEILRGQIASGQVGPGDRLPSETALSQTYGVATKTARAALQLLRDEGAATLVRGYGVVVRVPVEPDLVVVDEPGATVSARNPTPAERAELRVAEGFPLLIVHHPDGLQDLYPADRYRVVLSSPLEAGPAHG